ncbi:MAG: DUF5320 domain-containing protein [Nanoarchaeota archaeon]|nr:DUF5320 domain-containing protein [Nanoarchaeota archaeon]
MPNMDKTGPQGQGSRTGRQMGNCDNANGNNQMGCRRGFNRGLGRGCRRFAEPTQINLSQKEQVLYTKEEQVKILEAEKAEIEKQLNKLKD